MRIRKSVVVLAIASLFFWAPSVVPVKAIPICGVATLVPLDSAFAALPLPCPVPAHGAPTPVPVIGLIAGVVSVMLNAAIVWHTQCRELTTQEAISSSFLPLVGMAFNKNASKCPH
jgi:hypothetical protein